MHPRDVHTEFKEKLFNDLFEAACRAFEEGVVKSPTPRTSYTSPFPLSRPKGVYIKQLGLLRSINDLEELYADFTKDSHYIHNSYPFDKFCPRFTGIGEISLEDRIPWMENENVLSHIIITKMMRQIEFIPSSTTPHKLICNHFIWIKDGRAVEFDPERMRKNHHNAIGDVKKINAIDKIFAKFSK